MLNTEKDVNIIFQIKGHRFSDSKELEQETKIFEKHRIAVRPNMEPQETEYFTYMPCIDSDTGVIGWKLISRYNINKFKSDSMFRGYPVISLDRTFINYKNKDIDVTEVDTSNVLSMIDTFCGCKYLRHLDISNWNTSKVINMESMFTMSNIRYINMGGIDTSKVQNMQLMFDSCELLEEVNLQGIDTHQVSNMKQMFDGCRSLKNVDLKSFNTKNVIVMSSMFCRCKSLKEININFDIASLENADRMFEDCESIIDINLSSFKDSKLIQMPSIFGGCKDVKHIDLRNFKFAKSNSIEKTTYVLFDTCSKLSTVILKDNKLINEIKDCGFKIIKANSINSIDSIISKAKLFNEKVCIDTTNI